MTVKPVEKPQKDSEDISRTEGRRELGNTNYISVLLPSKRGKRLETAAMV